RTVRRATPGQQRTRFAVVAAITSAGFILASVAAALGLWPELQRGHRSLAWPIVDARIESCSLGPIVRESGGARRGRGVHTLDIRYTYEWAGEVRSCTRVALSD